MEGTIAPVLAICHKETCVGRQVRVFVSQLCPSLCDSMDYSPPGSSVHGVLQERILEWVKIPFSRGSSQPKDWTCVFCIAGRFFIAWAPRDGINEGPLAGKYFWKKFLIGREEDHTGNQATPLQLLTLSFFISSFLKLIFIEILLLYNVVPVSVQKIKTLIQKDICTPKCIAALFTIARTWKWLKCLSTEEQIKKTWYIYAREYYSAIEGNTKRNRSFREMWMDLETVLQSEVVRKRKTNIVYYSS